jgi:hypothetical protein
MKVGSNRNRFQKSLLPIPGEDYSTVRGQISDLDRGADIESFRFGKATVNGLESSRSNILNKDSV